MGNYIPPPETLLGGKQSFQLDYIQSFADDKSDVVHLVKIAFERLENNMRKGANVGYPNFLFP